LDLAPIPDGGNLTSENESFATNKNKKAGISDKAISA
jgi:hypothetical protein